MYHYWQILELTCFPEKISLCCGGGIPSFSSTLSLILSTLSVGSMSISISLPVSVFTLINIAMANHSNETRHANRQVQNHHQLLKDSHKNGLRIFFLKYGGRNALKCLAEKVPAETVKVSNLWDKLQSTGEENIAKKLDEDDCSPRSADMVDSGGLALDVHVHVDPQMAKPSSRTRKKNGCFSASHNRTDWKVGRGKVREGRRHQAAKQI